MPTGVCDEEDFVGFMFGVNEDRDSESSARESPQVISEGVRLRLKFVSQISEFLKSPRDSMEAIVALLDSMEETIGLIQADLQEGQHVVSESESALLTSSIDPSVHRDIMPPGPPRVVAPLKAPVDLYTDWKTVLSSIRKAIELLDPLISNENVSPFSIFNSLGAIRKLPKFRLSLLRAFLYHRVYYCLLTKEFVANWLDACSGGGLASLSKLHKGDLDLFQEDLVSVLQRVIHTLFRSASRQHRSLKSVLSDLSILQHRAWDLFMRSSALQCNAKGLWAFVALIGSTLVALNLALNLELSLVDLRTEEARLVFYLLESVMSVKLTVLNELLQKIANSNNVDVLSDLRSEMLVSAIEHSLSASVSHSLSACMQSPPSDQRDRIFELRCSPLLAFPLPKSIGLADFLTERTGPSSTDECLMWIEKAGKTFKPVSRIDGPLISGGLSGLKRTLLNNKFVHVKGGVQRRYQLEHKYHAIALSCVTIS